MVLILATSMKVAAEIAPVGEKKWEQAAEEAGMAETGKRQPLGSWLL